MEFTEKPPYELGKLSCIINATIEVRKINVEKLTTASIGKVNNALSGIGYGYKSTTNLGNQWIQLVHMFDQMNIDSKTKKEILKIASEKYEHLKTNKELL